MDRAPLREGRLERRSGGPLERSGDFTTLGWKIAHSPIVSRRAALGGDATGTREEDEPKMYAFLVGGGWPVFMLRALSPGGLAAEPSGLLYGVASLIEEATGFGALSALGAGGTLILIVVAIAVIRRVAAFVVSLALLAGVLAWWAGWLS